MDLDNRSPESDTHGHFTAVDDPALTPTLPYAISNGGVIVGFGFNHAGDARGWLLQARQFSPIDDPRGAEGTFAINIDELGDTVVGYYVDRHGVVHGFVVRI